MAKKYLHDPEYLRNRLAYNPDTGVLVWKSVSECENLTQKACAIINKKYAGKVAGTHINQWGYMIIGIRPKLYLLHRVAWAIYYGEWSDQEIDHIDGDKLNNRIDNLRSVSGTANRRNMPKQKNNTSGHTGITQRNGKWVVRIGCGSRSNRLYIGAYDNIEDAVKARKNAEADLGYSKNHGR